MKMLPRYPVYIPSRGRTEAGHTMKCFVKDGVPFSIVVEPQEHDKYAAIWGEEKLVTLPENDRGLVFARNWIWEHAKSEGHARHWQIDDNIREFWRLYNGLRFYCDAGPALRCTEDFVDRYENVAIAGLNYVMFLAEKGVYPPFVLNAHVYSCTLIMNSIPNRFRGGKGGQNEDVDMCLQVLSQGWCTVQVNAFCVQKIETMRVKGGQTAAAYQGDGRLAMTRRLVRRWPGVVEVGRRYRRPHHVVKDNWRRFDNKLKLKPGLDLSKFPKVDDYGLDLHVLQEPKHSRIRDSVEKYQREHPASTGKGKKRRSKNAPPTP